MTYITDECSNYLLHPIKKHLLHSNEPIASATVIPTNRNVIHKKNHRNVIVKEDSNGFLLHDSCMRSAGDLESDFRNIENAFIGKYPLLVAALLYINNICYIYVSFF